MSSDNGEYFLTLARIYRAQGRDEDAMRAISSALEKIPGNAAARAEEGRILYDDKKFDEASGIFGELAIDNPNDPMNYMLRAWVIAEGIGKSGDALPIYKRILELDVNQDLPSSLYGFALLFTGKHAEAIKWADEIVRDNNDTDGSVNYIAACLYAQAEETEKAFDCLETALNKGYANKYQYTVCDDARVNLAPIRKDPRFMKTLANYSYIFE